MADYPAPLRRAALLSAARAARAADRHIEPSAFLGVDSPSARLRVYLDAHAARTDSDPDRITTISNKATGGESLDLSPHDLAAVLDELDRLTVQVAQLHTGTVNLVTAARGAAETIATRLNHLAKFAERASKALDAPAEEVTPDAR
jgi:hypothetical protein